MRPIKFRNVYRRKDDGHTWMLEFPIHIAWSDEYSQLVSMADNDLWELIATIQYTGLLDSEGVEVFEGDVVGNGPLGGGSKRVIKWIESHASFNTPIADFKVIGNIYESPELI